MGQTSYIVFDLEWNQSAEGKQGEVRELPFEILEIGAVKLNSSLEPVGEFSCVIRPVVYTRLHYKVLEITHVGMEELKKRGPFRLCSCVSKKNEASLRTHLACGFRIVSEEGFDYLSGEANGRDYGMEYAYTGA